MQQLRMVPLVRGKQRSANLLGHEIFNTGRELVHDDQAAVLYNM